MKARRFIFLGRARGITPKRRNALAGGAGFALIAVAAWLIFME